MFADIRKTLRANPVYATVVLAGLLSNIGCGFTNVLIYGALSDAQAPASAYGLTLCLSLLPGLFSSQLGTRLCRRHRWNHILMALELAGAAILFIPYYGMATGQIALLQTAQFLASFLFGMSVPVGARFFRSAVAEKDLPAVSVINTCVFSVQIVFGVGLASLLYGKIPMTAFFVIDFMSYVFAALLVRKAGKSGTRDNMDPQSFAGKSSADGFRWSAISSPQKNAWLILPILTV